MKTALCAAVLLLTAAGASAQTVLTKVDLEGRFGSSDRPEATAPQQIEAVPAEAPKARIRRLVNPQRAASINAMEAERRLAQAKQKRQDEMEPLPGEFVPGAPGQLSYRYWQRQEKLRLDVERAQRRLNQTQHVQSARR